MPPALSVALCHSANILCHVRAVTAPERLRFALLRQREGDLRVKDAALKSEMTMLHDLVICADMVTTSQSLAFFIVMNGRYTGLLVKICDEFRAKLAQLTDAG